MIQTFRKFFALIEYVFIFSVLTTVWWLATTRGWVNPAFVPSPVATWRSLTEGLHSGELGPQTSSTVIRMTLGWGLATIVGILLGALIGLSATAKSWLGPMLEFVRPLPASAIMPLAIAIFGLSGNMVLSVVAFGAMWPVLLATIHGMTSVHTQLREVSQALEMSKTAFVWKIGFPNALPDILSGARLSLTVALIVSIVGEMIASQSGLGQAILFAARSFQSSELFAGIALLAAIGYVSNLMLSLAERHLLKWQTP